ncbi:MAG: hypothetical protein Q8823_00945 [Candidatus Phytoplasma australasiaticum]|nr:hypothetical protein [Candidatus Phytoplasma australasiaticum]
MVFLISITNSPHLNRTSKFPSIRLAIIYPLFSTNLVSITLLVAFISCNKLLTSFAL